MKNTNDRKIRAALKEAFTQQLSPIYHKEFSSAYYLSELGLNYGDVRIDFVMIHHILHGFEIKSDADTLLRLPNQIDIYNQVFDKLTLVVGETHIIKALQLIPEWWGVILAKGTPEGRVLFSNIRTPESNPSIDKVSLSRLLWKKEALDILKLFNCEYGVKSKTRELIYQRLATSLSATVLKDKVREKLLNRAAWRAEKLQPLYGD